MKNILLLISLVVVAVGCSPQAPTMKRVVSYDLIDEHYLKEVFVPSFADQTSKSALSNSVIQLDARLPEFRDFLHQVEAGKIAVTKNMKGGWQSYVVTDEVSMLAGYSSRLGLVSQFDKRKNQDPYPLIYGSKFLRMAISHGRLPLRMVFSLMSTGRFRDIGASDPSNDNGVPKSLSATQDGGFSSTVAEGSINPTCLSSRWCAAQLMSSQKPRSPNRVFCIQVWIFVALVALALVS
ncbi:MAG: hypothetical protein V9H26_14890 [Verrucomicrobiota bacterium]